MVTLKDRKRKEAEINLKRYEKELDGLLKNNSSNYQERIIELQHLIQKQKQILHNLNSYKK